MCWEIKKHHLIIEVYDFTRVCVCQLNFMVFQINEHHVKHDGGGRPLNMLNIPRIMILLIARNMFDDVRNIRVELVYSVLLYI